MATLKKDQLLEMYYHMVLIRRFEEKCAELYQQGLIGGFLHLYIGQEAVGVGAVHAMTADDHVFTAYRDHGIALARGVPADAALAELLGKETGVSGGRGGSMHFGSRKLNFWGGYGIVGGHLPLAAGVAIRARYMEEDFAVVCFMGDGATNIGYFHESLNLSAVWDLPVVWLVENNQYGMGTAVARASGAEEIYRKAEAYGMHTLGRVDGMDVLTVYEKTMEALDYARKNGPVLMEVMTYRYQGHSMGDPERYRTKDEIAKYREGDPIQKFRDTLTSKKKIKVEELDEIERRVIDEVEDAEKFAKESNPPALDTLTNNIYVDDLERNPVQ